MKKFVSATVFYTDIPNLKDYKGTPVLIPVDYNEKDLGGNVSQVELSEKYMYKCDSEYIFKNKETGEEKMMIREEEKEMWEEVLKTE